MVKNTIQMDCDMVTLNKAITHVNGKLSQMPHGHLRVCKDKKGHIRYYYKHRENGQMIDQSLRHKDPLIRQLANKAYLKDLLPVLQKEWDMVKLIEQYDPQRKYMIYDNLSDERKCLVDPLFESVEMKVRKWQDEEWTGYTNYQEGLRYETERGELVRSKSERNIANLLYLHKDILDYHYEQQLFLPKSRIYVHLDFTIINKKTARIFYWEHVGMLDQEKYANDHARKMNAYITDGLFPADNFIMTYETSDVQENVYNEKLLIKRLLEG